MRKLVLVGLLAVTVGLLAAPALADEDDEHRKNQVSDWCETGVKFDDADTPFIVPPPPDGYVWTLLVLKSGSTAGQNETFPNPIVGDGYSHTLGDNSHAILCKEPAPETTTTTSTTTTQPEVTTTTEPEVTTTTEPEVTTTTVAETTTTVPDTTTSIPTGVPTGEPLQGSDAARNVGIAAALSALLLTGAFARRVWLAR